MFPVAQWCTPAWASGSAQALSAERMSWRAVLAILAIFFADMFFFIENFTFGL